MTLCELEIPGFHWDCQAFYKGQGASSDYCIIKSNLCVAILTKAHACFHLHLFRMFFSLLVRELCLRLETKAEGKLRSQV